MLDPVHAAWFLEHRGLTAETLEAFRVRSENGAAILPYPRGGEKRRPMGVLGVEDPRFTFTPDVKPWLFGEELLPAQPKAIFLCEGETDTMRLWQEIKAEGRTDLGVVGLGGVQTWTADMVDAFRDVRHVFVVLDNDADYLVQGNVDAAWKRLRHDLGPKGRRVRLPSNTKDLCAFFEHFDFETLSLIVKKGTQTSRFRTLDLNKTPPEPNWLLEGLVALGDTTLLSGVPKLGKSWLTMGLAVAVVEGHESFLGRDVKRHGDVLYVDEENPEDVVYSRLHQLGLSTEGKRRLRYIWNDGLRLDRDPTALLDEACAYNPTLIVLDSLTRLHTGEENKAGEMAALFNDSIKPLARETGAAVLLIHHHDKSGSGPRGSGDIYASVDAALDVFSAGDHNPGAFNLQLTGSRRRLGGDDFLVRIEDAPDGSVHLRANAPFNAPF